jgi:hypothetical protein
MTGSAAFWVERFHFVARTKLPASRFSIKRMIFQMFFLHSAAGLVFHLAGRAGSDTRSGVDAGIGGLQGLVRGESVALLN